MTRIFYASLTICACVLAIFWFRMPHDKSFPVPVTEAESLLSAIEPPGEIFGSQPVLFETIPNGKGQVDWPVKMDGQEVMRFSAVLTADGDAATRVHVDIKGATSGPFGNVDARLSELSSIRTVYQQAMEERVAAALEKRPYDILKVMPAVAAATFANIGAISGQMDAAAEEFRKRDQENIERAYAEEGQGY